MAEKANTANSTENVIIIGSGPAGYTAAIYTARADLKPLVFEGAISGGQLMWTTEVENFPGFPEGILGPRLMGNMKKQAERFGARFVHKEVTKADFKKAPFKLWCGKERFEAKTVILATGAEHKKLDLPSERKFSGKGVSYCAVCDAAFFRDKAVAVVGGGDAAVEEALFLAKYAKKVHVIHRRDCLRASDIMQKRAFADRRIDFLWNSEIKEIFGRNFVEGVKLFNNKTNKDSTLECQGVFIAIGLLPNTKIFEGQLDTVKGYIITKPDSTQTKIAGIFAAGDVRDWKYKQAITAAASGCMAALEAEAYLQKMEQPSRLTKFKVC